MSRVYAQRFRQFIQRRLNLLQLGLGSLVPLRNLLWRLFHAAEHPPDCTLRPRGDNIKAPTPPTPSTVNGTAHLRMKFPPSAYLS